MHFPLRNNVAFSSGSDELIKETTSFLVTTSEDTTVKLLSCTICRRITMTDFVDDTQKQEMRVMQTLEGHLYATRATSSSSCDKITLPF